MKIYWKTFLKHRTKDDSHAFPTQSIVFYVLQGQGKTLSMVDYAFRIKKEFPECVIFSNIRLNGIDYKYIYSDEDVKDALSYTNGKKGVLVLLDEAHLYFGKKTGIGLETLTAISQQRKDRRRIVFSSQIWEELDISLRKQVKDIVKCRKFLNIVILNYMKGETLHYNKLESTYEADHDHYEIFKLNDEFYNRYDTYQKIVTNDEMLEPLAGRSPMAQPAIQVQVKKGIFK